MHLRNATRTVTGVLLASLLVAGCAEGGTEPGGQQSDKDTFDVVLNTGMTGPRASIAADILLGLKTAADEINAAGGIDGRLVRITTLDSQGDPTKGVSEMQNYLSSGKTPDLVHAGINSGETLALLPLLTQRKIISISQSQSSQLNDPAKYPYHFGVSPTSLDSGRFFGEKFVEDGVKKLAAVLPSDAFGDDVERMLMEVTGQSGVALTVERFDVGTDASASYQRAIAGKPDAVFIDGAGEAATALFAARLKVGATNIRTYGGSAISSVAPTTIAEPAALTNCSFMVYTFTVEGALTAQSADAIAPLTKAVQAAKTNVFVPGLGYDALRVIAKAAEKGGSDPESLQKTLSSLTIDTGYLVVLPGGFSYSANSHFPGAPKKGDQTLVPCTATNKDGFWHVA